MHMSSYYPSFSYLGVNSRERNLVISNFDPDNGEHETYLSMEPIYTESADGSRRIDYGAKYNNVASFRVTAIKPDGNDLSVDEIRNHLKWLTGSKKNSPLELVEHFSEEFIGDGKTPSIQLSNTGVGKNLLDCAQICPTSNSAILEFIDENEFRLHNTEAQTYISTKGATLKLKAGITYTFSLDVTKIVSGDIRFGFRYTSNNSFAATGTTVTSTGHFVNHITPNTDIEVYPSVLVTWSEAIVGDATFNNLQVEIGSSDTAYTEYAWPDGSNHIFYVSVNGKKLTNNEWTYDGTDGIVSLTNVPAKESVIKISYGRIKYSFTGRITNAWQYKMDARTIGLIFEFTSISPWAYSAPQIQKAVISGSKPITIINKTDDLYGYTSMNTVFENTTGTALTINNNTINEHTTVTNIANNEIITISDNMMITSDNPSKVFGNSFNFVFPRLVAGENKLNISGTGTITFEYVYCIKIGDCAMDINAMSDPIYDDDGNISLELGMLPWSRITDLPTTYQGYGITNVYSKTEVNELVASIEIDENELNAMLAEELN